MLYEIIFSDQEITLTVECDGALVKPFVFIARYWGGEKRCRLYCEIISDMANSFEPYEIYDTIAQKLMREFPLLEYKDDIIKLLDRYDIVGKAKEYTEKNDKHLETIEFYY